MDILYKKLYSIKKNPIIYIGKRSIILLRAYIDGYVDRIMEENPDYTSTFWGFHDYVVEYYKVFSNHNWDRIITAYTSDDDMAFDMFYTLLDKYQDQISAK